jgi:hypothetical protein
LFSQRLCHLPLSCRRALGCQRDAEMYRSTVAGLRSATIALALRRGKFLVGGGSGGYDTRCYSQARVPLPLPRIRYNSLTDFPIEISRRRAMEQDANSVQVFPLRW